MKGNVWKNLENVMDTRTQPKENILKKYLDN